MSKVLVMYVGSKPSRADTVAGTGVVWHGEGDVQAVPEEAVAKLLKHPDVWELVPAGAKAQTPYTGASLAGAIAAKPVAQPATQPAIQPASTVAPVASGPDAEAVVGKGLDDGGKPDGKGEGEGKAAGAGDGLEAMTLEQLRDLCTAREIAFSPLAKEANLIAKLRA